MDALFANAPTKPALTGNGSGGIVFEATSRAMTSGSDAFREVLTHFDSEARCTVGHVCDEAGQAAGLFKETKEAEILDIMSAATGSGPAGSEKVSVLQGTALAIGFLTGDELHDEGEAALPAAKEERAEPEVSEGTEETNGRPTGDPLGTTAFTTGASLPPFVAEAAAPAVPAATVASRQTATDDVAPGMTDHIPARPITASRNQVAEDQPPPLRGEPASQISQPFAQRGAHLPNQMEQPAAERRFEPALSSGPARGHIDLDPQAESGRAMGVDAPMAQGPAGPNRPVNAAGSENGHLTAKAVGDCANRTGEGWMSDQPTANEQGGRELGGMPKSLAAVRLDERNHRFSIEAASLHAPTASGSGPGLQPADHPQEPNPIHPDVLPRPADGLGTGKTVHAVQVNLDPDDLGRVRVRVVLTDSTVHTHVTTESADLSQFLIGHRDQLESVFQASGLNMGQFKVHLDHEGSGQSANDWIARSFGDHPPHAHGRHKPMEPDHGQPSSAEPHGLSVFA